MSYELVYATKSPELPPAYRPEDVAQLKIEDFDTQETAIQRACDLLREGKAYNPFIRNEALGVEINMTEIVRRCAQAARR